MRALVRFVVEVGAGLLVAGGGWFSGARAGEQAGFGFDEDARLTRRFSLQRMPSVFFGRIGRSRAWPRSRARIARPAAARAVRICWYAGWSGMSGRSGPAAGEGSGSVRRVLRVMRRFSLSA